MRNPPAGNVVAARIVRRALILAMAAGVSACGVMDAAQRGHQRVWDMWAADNKTVLEREGTRTVDASVPTSVKAAQSAMQRIGLTVDDNGTVADTVVATRPLSSSDVSPAVEAAELPRVKKIMDEEIGPLSEMVHLQQPGVQSLLEATAHVTAAGRKSRVSVSMCNRGIGANKTGQCVIPTAQYRAGLYEFWRAFEQELRTTAATIAHNGEEKRTHSTTHPRAATNRVTATGGMQTSTAPTPVIEPSQWVLPD